MLTYKDLSKLKHAFCLHLFLYFHMYKMYMYITIQKFGTVSVLCFWNRSQEGSIWSKTIKKILKYSEIFLQFSISIYIYFKSFIHEMAKLNFSAAITHVFSVAWSRNHSDMLIWWSSTNLKIILLKKAEYKKKYLPAFYVTINWHQRAVNMRIECY